MKYLIIVCLYLSYFQMIAQTNLSFKKGTKVIAKYRTEVRDTPVLVSNNIIGQFEIGDTIKIFGFKNNFLEVNYKNKFGYSYFYDFEGDSEVKSQIDSLKAIESIEVEKEQIKRHKLDSLTNVLDSLEAGKAELEEKIKFYEKVQKFQKMGSPLMLINAEVSFNSIDKPEANITVVNISNKIVDAFTVEILCYNNFNQAVNHYLYRKNIFKGISQEEINIGESLDSIWDLFGYDNTTKIKVILKKVHFKNNTTWIAKTNNVFAKSY